MNGTGVFPELLDAGAPVVEADSLPAEMAALTSDPRARGLLARGDAYDLLPLLPEKSVDLILTSPPYWGQRSYGQEHNWDILDEWKALGNTDSVAPPYEWYRAQGGILGLEPIPDWFVSHLVEVFERARGCLKPGGSFWVNLGDTYYARWASIREEGRQGLGSNVRVRRRTPMGGYRHEKQLLLIPARFAIAMQDRRWILRNDVIWYKPNVPPRPEKDRLRYAHEHFFHFVHRARLGRPSYYYDAGEAEPKRDDVVTCLVRRGEEGHSATFPEDLVSPRIRSSCPPGGVVLDPFCGSGRALAVAVEHGRRAVGFDLNDDFLAVSRRLIYKKLHG